MKHKISGPMATVIAERIEIAMQALKAKGYECPKISLGLEMLGEYGPIVYARINLSSPKCSMRRLPYDQKPTSIEGLLDEIDASVAEIPAASAQDEVRRNALEKLSKEERELIGIPLLGSF